MFCSVLNDYALEESWIKRISIENENFDTLKYVLNISIPPDLSVTELLLDINKTFQRSESYFVSEELKNFGKSSVKIYSGGILKFQAYVSTDKTILRNTNKVALFVDVSGGSLNSEKDIVAYSEIPYSYTLLLLATTESIKIKNNFLDGKREYGVIIGDQAIDEKYQLSGKFNKTKLSSNIRNITENFRDASIYIIDDNSNLYSSAVYSYIKNEFSQKKIKFYKKSNFKKLLVENESEILSLFNFFTSGEDISVTQHVFISIKNFNLLQQQINSRIKKGTKFVYVN